MAQILFFPMLLFLAILLYSPVFLQMQTQQEILYSRDTPEHWTSKGRELAEWPTKWLDPYKESYTVKELEDWYCVTNTGQLNGGDKEYLFFWKSAAAGDKM
jgi:hypothetical protein